MEPVVTKKSKTRKRKRYVKNKQRRIRRKLEVKGIIRRKSFTNNISSMASGESQTVPMSAQCFWDNYEATQEWRRRHKVAWWKSRCFALEWENEVLRQKIRNLAALKGQWSASIANRNKDECEATTNQPETHEEVMEDDNDENLEFQVDQGMLDFLEQSIRHKMELKRSRMTEREVAASEAIEDAPFVTCEARQQAKTKNAELLYGESSPIILAMEAALQATIERHRDCANPQFWPNIPLKP